MARLGAMLLAVVVAGCSTASAPTARPTAETTPLPDPTLPSDALSQMEIAFEGSPRRSVIQAALDEAFGYYGLPPGEDTYRMAGDILVSLRQSAMARGCDGCTEMAILELVSQLGREGTPSAFEEAAAEAVAILYAND